MFTFKTMCTLLEARRKDLNYTEKKAKDVVQSVTVQLKGAESAGMTKVARRYARLEASISALGAARDKMNKQLKEDLAEMFDAEDKVLTRVVATAQFTLTLNKEIQSTTKKKNVNFEKIADELAKLIPEELQPKIDEIIKLYTTYTDPAAPVAKLSVSKEEIKEGVGDLVKRIIKKIASFVESITSWGVKYDAKLAALEHKLQPVSEGMVKHVAFKNVENVWEEFSKSDEGKKVIKSAKEMFGADEQEDAVKYILRAVLAKHKLSATQKDDMFDLINDKY